MGNKTIFLGSWKRFLSAPSTDVPCFEGFPACFPNSLGRGPDGIGIWLARDWLRIVAAEIWLVAEIWIVAKIWIVAVEIWGARGWCAEPKVPRLQTSDERTSVLSQLSRARITHFGIHFGWRNLRLRVVDEIDWLPEGRWLPFVRCTNSSRQFRNTEEGQRCAGWEFYPSPILTAYTADVLWDGVRQRTGVRNSSWSGGQTKAELELKDQNNIIWRWQDKWIYLATSLLLKRTHKANTNF